MLSPYLFLISSGSQLDLLKVFIPARIRAIKCAAALAVRNTRSVTGLEREFVPSLEGTELRLCRDKALQGQEDVKKSISQKFRLNRNVC